jgi:hypothetical protein
MPKSSDQADIEGESFYFKVNGVPIYMKGANLVPLHILPTNVSKAAVHELLQYALQSNMNMIRIWGGGMYPVSDNIMIKAVTTMLLCLCYMACQPRHCMQQPLVLSQVAACPMHALSTGGNQC